VANTLKSNPGVKVEVVGHTDAIGASDYNMTLSEERAKMVKQYLVDQGVSADRIAISWRGEEAPKGDNSTSEGRAANRRAEIKQGN
jgi:OOP family OmpA-OmpF porin